MNTKIILSLVLIVGYSCAAQAHFATEGNGNLSGTKWDEKHQRNEHERQMQMDRRDVSNKFWAQQKAVQASKLEGTKYDTITVASALESQR